MQKNFGKARAIVGQNIAALLQHIERKPRSTILDFGCGPGRDLKVFAELDHTAMGLEGAARAARTKRKSQTGRCAV
jgi:cyclopropane fatty-acyl-phospholipid synthase-like methyltransferase